MASILRAEDKYDAAIDYIRSILALNAADGESWSSLGTYRVLLPPTQSNSRSRSLLPDDGRAPASLHSLPVCFVQPA